jgi:hypothetical protein
MASLFISYSRRDAAAAKAIRKQLRAAGFQAVFLDVDPEDGIPAGQPWERELYARVRLADAIVFLSSPAATSSQWCFAELTLARATGTPIIPVVVEGEIPPLLAGIQAIPFKDGRRRAKVRLIRALRQHGLDPRDSFTFDPMTQPPYPGLRSFSEQDAAVFFGREQKIKELLEVLEAAYNPDQVCAHCGAIRQWEVVASPCRAVASVGQASGLVGDNPPVGAWTTTDRGAGPQSYRRLSDPQRSTKTQGRGA